MTRVTLGKSRMRESRTSGSVRAKAEWLSYSTVTALPLPCSLKGLLQVAMDWGGNRCQLGGCLRHTVAATATVTYFCG